MNEIPNCGVTAGGVLLESTATRRHVGVSPTLHPLGMQHDIDPSGACANGRCIASQLFYHEAVGNVMIRIGGPSVGERGSISINIIMVILGTIYAYNQFTQYTLQRGVLFTRRADKLT